MALLKLYMTNSNLSLDSEERLFSPVSSCSNRKRIVSVSKPISYSTFREPFKQSFRDIVPDISKFSTHSARSGGATLAANSGVSERNLHAVSWPLRFNLCQEQFTSKPF